MKTKLRNDNFYHLHRYLNVFKRYLLTILQFYNEVVLILDSYIISQSFKSHCRITTSSVGMRLGATD